MTIFSFLDELTLKLEIKHASNMIKELYPVTNQSLSHFLVLQKLHVFLFQDVLVITRAITQNEQLWYQLYRQPIPVKDLEWEDLQDGEMRLGGSIRGAFSNHERSESEFNQISSKVTKVDRYLKCGDKKR